MTVLAMAVNAWLYLGPARVYRERDPVYADVARWLRADPCRSGATMFVWGYAPAFYYAAGIEAGVGPGSRFVVLPQARLTGYAFGDLERSREGELGSTTGPAWDLLLVDLDHSRTTYVLDTAPAGIYRWNHYPVARYPVLADYLAAHYAQVATIDRVRVFRRTSCGGTNRESSDAR